MLFEDSLNEQVKLLEAKRNKRNEKILKYKKRYTNE